MSNIVRFTFVGDPVIPNKGLITEGKTPWDSESLRLSLGVKVDDSTVFAGLYDSVKETIKTIDTDNQPMEIDWEDRTDEQAREKVAGFRKYRTNIGSDETLTFITGYDFISYLAAALQDYNDPIVVNGTLDIRYDNKGILRKNYNITSVWKARENEAKKLAVIGDLYFSSKALDKSCFDETKKMFLDSYVLQYINKDEGSKFVPFPTVLNLSKYNDENEHHQQLKKFKLSCIEYKKNTIHHMMWEMRVVDGTEEVEFTEDQLTPLQKMQIELGTRTLDDFRPRGSIRGPRNHEIRLFEPVCMGDFENGLVDSGMKISEFEDQIYIPAKDESVESMETVDDHVSDSTTKDASDDELF